MYIIVCAYILYKLYTVQITHNVNGTRMWQTPVCAMYAKANNTCDINPPMRVHICKINAPHSCTYPYKVHYISHEMILVTTRSVLNFTI